jgi:hypothetical protein
MRQLQSEAKGSNRVAVSDCVQAFCFQLLRERDLQGLATNIVCSFGACGLMGFLS